MGVVKVLKASAGSGKTYKLAYEYVKNIILEPISYRHILAVTFTNKATTEMKSRILEEIDKLCSGEGFLDSFVEELNFDNIEKEIFRSEIVQNAKKAQSLILHDYSNFSVMTIDRFFQKVFRAFCNELGLDTTFSVGLNDKYYMSIAIDTLIDNFRCDKRLERWVTSLLDARISDSKSYNFKRDILEISPMIFSREFDREYYLNNIEVIEQFFTTMQQLTAEIKQQLFKKALALKDAIDRLELTEADFIRGRAGLYPYVSALCRGEFKSPNTYVMTMLDIDSKWKSKTGRADDHKEVLHPLLVDFVSCWNENQKDYVTSIIIQEKSKEFLLLLYVAKELVEVCRTNNTLLLSSSVKIITSLINNNDTPYIYEKIGNRYDVLMIDEFQDTSFEQWNNFVPLVLNSLSIFDDDRTSVTLVGDVKQSIYMWRGGDWRILEREVANRVSSNNIDYEWLDTNWRSEKNIVTFNNHIIRASVEQLNLQYNEDIETQLLGGNISREFRNEYLDVFNKLYENMEQKVSPKNIDTGGYVQVDINENGEINLEQCVRVIEDCQLRGYQPSEIAILVRAKNHIPIITQYLSQYVQGGNAIEGLSYSVTSKEGLLLKNSPLVQFLIACYKLSENIGDTISVNYFNFYLSGEYINTIDEQEVLFLSKLDNYSICDSFEKLLTQYQLTQKIEQLAYLQAFHDKIITFSRGAYPDIPHFLEFWENESQGWGVELPSQQNAIRIETIHAVKGLEFDVVIIPFGGWSLTGSPTKIWAESSKKQFMPFGKLLVPKRKDMLDSYFSENYMESNILESIESFNIFYVAVTRASKELYVMVDLSTKKALGKIISNCFVEQDDMVSLKTVDSQFNGSVQGDSYCFGKKETFELRSESATKLINSYSSIPYNDRVILVNANDKYFDADNDSTQKRELGILKHKVFEQISYLSDIDAVLENMTQMGELSLTQNVEIQNSITKSLENPIIADFFDTRWQIRNEDSILLNDDHYNVYRPDRVMCSGDTAIIVDYKFGKESKYYRKQVERYKELLTQMGYRNVKGYIWYIEQEHVVEVN